MLGEIIRDAHAWWNVETGPGHWRSVGEAVGLRNLCEDGSFIPESRVSSEDIMRRTGQYLGNQEQEQAGVSD